MSMKTKIELTKKKKWKSKSKLKVEGRASQCTGEYWKGFMFQAKLWKIIKASGIKKWHANFRHLLSKYPFCWLCKSHDDQ